MDIFMIVLYGILGGLIVGAFFDTKIKSLESEINELKEKIEEMENKISELE